MKIFEKLISSDKTYWVGMGIFIVYMGLNLINSLMTGAFR